MARYLKIIPVHVEVGVAAHHSGDELIRSTKFLTPQVRWCWNCEPVSSWACCGCAARPHPWTCEHTPHPAAHHSHTPPWDPVHRSPQSYNRQEDNLLVYTWGQHVLEGGDLVAHGHPAVLLAGSYYPNLPLDVPISPLPLTLQPCCPQWCARPPPRPFHPQHTHCHPALWRD